MLYNKVEFTDIESTGFQSIVKLKFDMVEHDTETPVYFAMLENDDVRFTKDSEPVEGDVWPWLSNLLRREKKDKFANVAVFFRERNKGDYPFEILDVIQLKGFRYYYLTKKELKELFRSRKCKLAKRSTGALYEILRYGKYPKGNYVGLTSSRLCDRYGNPIRVRI